MLTFAEWLINQQKKKKEPKNERHPSQTDSEIGHQDDQGEATGTDSQIPDQGVLVLAIKDIFKFIEANQE